MSILASHCPLFPNIPEWFFIYLTYRQTYIRISFKGLEDYNILQSLGVNTVFRSDYLYLASSILCILHVEDIALSDFRHSSTYELLKYSSGLTVLSVIDLKS